MGLEGLDDRQLEAGLKAARERERRDCTEVLRHLIEFDRRDLAERKGFSSLFIYCMKELGYSENETKKRIMVARKAASLPAILDELNAGKTSLSAMAVLAPHLTDDNHSDLLANVRGKSKREVEFIVAERFPQREQRETMRPLAPATTPTAAVQAPEGGGPAAAPLLEPYPRVKPFAPDRVRFEFNGSRDLYEKIERAKQLLRHKYPFCTLEQLFGESLESLLDDWDPERRMARKKPSSAAPKPGRPAATKPAGEAAAGAPDPGGRFIPQSVKDEVYRRDGGQCAFRDSDGRRCQERGALEYDHVVPHALGGLSVADNLRLLCEGHNRYEARRRFGAWVNGARQPDAKRGRPEGTREGELPMSG